MVDQSIAALSVRFYNVERPTGIVLSVEDVTAQAIAATAFYAGYGPIKSLITPAPAPPTPVVNDPNDFLFPITFAWGFPGLGFGLAPRIVAGSPVTAVEWVDENTLLSQSEWSVIRPLFVLYVERENALHLEASRGLGVDVYGRSSSEVGQDIAVYETEQVPKRSFNQQIISV